MCGVLVSRDSVGSRYRAEGAPTYGRCTTDGEAMEPIEERGDASREFWNLWVFGLVVSTAWGGPGHALAGYDLCGYGLHSDGLYSYGLYSFDLDRWSRFAMSSCRSVPVANTT